jgi:hypothetical protein
MDKRLLAFCFWMKRQYDVAAEQGVFLQGIITWATPQDREEFYARIYAKAAELGYTRDEVLVCYLKHVLKQT